MLTNRVTLTSQRTEGFIKTNAPALCEGAFVSDKKAANPMVGGGRAAAAKIKLRSF